MNLSVLVDTIISILGVVIVLSIICSSVFELIGRFTRNRSKMLWSAIEKALEDPGLSTNFAQKLYEHPQIRSMHRTNLDKPSYLSPGAFATTLIDVMIEARKLDLVTYEASDGKYTVAQDSEDTSKAAQLKEAVESIAYSDVGRLVGSFIDVDDTLENIKARIEEWYAGYMDRVAGWYKRKTQKLLLILGIAMSIAINADLLTITRTVYEDATLRKELLPLAENLAKEQNQKEVEKTSKEIVDDIKTRYDSLKATGIPLGWSEKYTETLRKQPLLSLLGWFLMGLLISRGAPFWFNLLNSLLNLRSTGRSDYQPKKGTS